MANTPEASTDKPKRRPSWWWLFAFGVGWPAALFGVSALRFGGLPRTDGGLDLLQIISGAVGFTLLGVLSGLVALWIARGRPARAVRVGTIVGYVLTTPVAFVAGLIGPLSFEVLYNVDLPQWVVYLVLFPIGVTLAGLIPLVVGSAAGFALGSATAARSSKSKA